jgi:hypothetical protein
VVAGYSSSGVSGTKTTPSYGGSDFWVIKLDAAGNETWQKSFGGSGIDELRTLQLTSDGGYLLGGTSQSGISGNKTSQNYGGEDYWIVKTDSEGNATWDDSFGGSLNDQLAELRPLNDGGYLLAGTSLSGSTGIKTTLNIGNSDFWLIKLSPPVPRLEITTSENSVVLTWPSALTNFELQENTDLTSTNWTNVSIIPADDGTYRRLTLPVLLEKSFYRLQVP